METEIKKALIETGFIPAPEPEFDPRAQFKASLIAHGKTIKGWAKEHGFKAQQVTDVITGRSKCNYGISHKIAVAMGIKPGAGTN